MAFLLDWELSDQPLIRPTGKTCPRRVPLLRRRVKFDASSRADMVAPASSSMAARSRSLPATRRRDARLDFVIPLNGRNRRRLLTE
jgi:hypothetical protein